VNQRFAVGVIGGALVLAVGAGVGVYEALGGESAKVAGSVPLGGAGSRRRAGVVVPSASPAPAAAAGSASCTIGESGHDAQITLSGNGTSGSTCSRFGQSLAQDAGGFWQVETQDSGLALVCVMDLPGGSTATVMDDGGELIGEQLCQDLQAAGDTEDTASEAAIVQGQESASAAAAAAAASASAVAAQASQEAATYQDAQAAVSDVQGGAQSVLGDAQTVSNDTATAGSDLQTEQKDAAQGQGDDCENVATVDADATGTLAADESGTIAADVQSASSDIQQLRSSISALQQDDHALGGDGMSAPTGASSVISGAQTAITQAIGSINSDIDKVAQDVATGYQLADSLATGSCSNGYAPEAAPTPPGHLS
jgi:hypothetical protein